MKINKIWLLFKQSISGAKYLKRRINTQRYLLANKNKNLPAIDIKSINLNIKEDKELIANANKILGGNLNLYSSTRLRVGKKINWHKDYLSGYQWPKNKFFQEIEYQYPLGTDIKNPWEISRFQQMPTLGLAYQKTKNEKYTQYFVDQTRDWIKQNPVYFGINWKCPMEVAIRACNWLLAYNLFRNSKLLNKKSKFYKIFAGSLKEHGDYIFQNLENLGVKIKSLFCQFGGINLVGIALP